MDFCGRWIGPFIIFLVTGYFYFDRYYDSFKVVDEPKTQFKNKENKPNAENPKHHRIHTPKNPILRNYTFPNVLGVGIKKCGTSALLRFLKTHSQIAVSTEYEPQFFTDEKTFKNGLDTYKRFFPTQGHEKIVFEKSPGYSKSRNAARRIFGSKQLNPSRLKLVFVVCNPVDRAWSDYMYTYPHVTSNKKSEATISGYLKTRLVETKNLKFTFN